LNTAELLSFMREHVLAVQSSVSSTGVPQAAVVGFVVTDALEVFFDTDAQSRKVGNLRRNPACAVVIGGTSPVDERTVQYEGLADEPAGDELQRLKEVYFGVFPDGRQREAWPGITYIRVRPTWIRYVDFNIDPPEIVEFDQSQPAGAS
jgi:general stress protein 26